MEKTQQGIMDADWSANSYISLDDDEPQALPVPPKTSVKNEKKKNDNATASSKDDEKRTFLPPTDKRRAKKMKAMLKTPATPKKGSKVKKGLKIASFALLATLLGVFTYNTIKSSFYNEIPPTKDPYTSDNVFDANDNDFEFGNDGQIILDTMDQTEKNVLVKSFSDLISNDAKSRCASDVGYVKNIISISLLPYNLNDETNEMDKYYVSILFNDGNDTFCLKYLAGTDFVSDAEFTKDYFIDFINYLSFECALSSCEKMSDEALKLKDLFEGAQFVGEAYKGYRENGDRFYYIPVYYKNGEGETYYSWATSIDTFDKNPMQVLYDELTTDAEKTFDFTTFPQSESFKKVSKILEEQLQLLKNTSSSFQNAPLPASKLKAPSSSQKFDDIQDETNL